MNVFIPVGGTSSLKKFDVCSRDNDPLSIVKLRFENAGLAPRWKKPKVGGKIGHSADPAKVRLPNDSDLIADLQPTPGFGHFLFRPLTADR
jgi:hypothetical protein